MHPLVVLCVHFLSIIEFLYINTTQSGGYETMNNTMTISEVFTLNGMTGAQLLSMPGVYEIVSEELNDDVIEAIEEEAAALR